MNVTVLMALFVHSWLIRPPAAVGELSRVTPPRMSRLDLSQMHLRDVVQI